MTHRFWFVRTVVVLGAILIFYPLAYNGVVVQAGDDTISSAPGWRYRVIADKLPGVDNLVLTRDGTLYATRELPWPQGDVMRILGANRDTVLSGLDRPDGLALRNGLLYVTEEVEHGRIIEFDPDTGSKDKPGRVLARLSKPEGIDFLSSGDLVLSEDIINGRLLRLKQGKIDVIARGLRRPEGLCVYPDGSVVVAETLSGRILAVDERGRIRTLVDGLNEPDQVELDMAGFLWITEDAMPGRLLRFKDNNLEVIMNGLWAPQGMAFSDDGTLYLAEQGRMRILAVTYEAAP